jgi:hypothetical protein
VIVHGYPCFWYLVGNLLWRDSEGRWVGNASYLFEKEPSLEGACGEVLTIHGWYKSSRIVLILTDRGALTIFDSGSEHLTKAYIEDLTPEDGLKGKTLLGVEAQENQTYTLVTSGGEYTLQWVLQSSEFASAEITAAWTPLEDLYVSLLAPKDPATLSVLKEVEKEESLAEYFSKDFGVPVFVVDFTDSSLRCVVRFRDAEMAQVALWSI